MKKHQNGFAHLALIVVFLVVVAVIALAGWQVFSRRNDGGYHPYVTDMHHSYGGPGTGGPAWNDPRNNEVLEAANMASCRGTSQFTSPIADLSTIDYIEPLGHTSSYNGNSQHVFPVDHMYVSLRHTQPSNPQSDTLSATVLSPGDIEIFQVKDVTYLKNNQVIGHDYTMYMAPCKEVTIYLGHIDTVSQAIQNAVAQATGDKKFCQPDFTQDGTTFRPCGYSVLVNVKAGEQLGTAGGPGVRTQAFDYGTYDARVAPLAFVDQKYWTPENLHAVCGLNYYPAGAVKTAQFQKLKSTKITAGLPDCGNNMWDVAGTLQGNWILPGTPTGPVPDMQGLSIAPYDMDPSQIVVDWGGTIAPADRVTVHTAASGVINRLPSQVTADGKVYCYSDSYKAVSIQLVDGSTLKAEEHSGSCPRTPVLANPTTYAR